MSFIPFSFSSPLPFESVMRRKFPLLPFHIFVFLRKRGLGIKFKCQELGKRGRNKEEEEEEDMGKSNFKTIFRSVRKEEGKEEQDGEKTNESFRLLLQY